MADNFIATWGLKPIDMEVCYWALLFVPLVILHHLLNCEPILQIMKLITMQLSQSFIHVIPFSRSSSLNEREQISHPYTSTAIAFNRGYIYEFLNPAKLMGNNECFIIGIFLEAVLQP
jgi:hypothetical protein